MSCFSCKPNPHFFVQYYTVHLLNLFSWPSTDSGLAQVLEKSISWLSRSWSRSGLDGPGTGGPGPGAFKAMMCTVYIVLVLLVSMFWHWTVMPSFWSCQRPSVVKVLLILKSWLYIYVYVCMYIYIYLFIYLFIYLLWSGSCPGVVTILSVCKSRTWSRSVHRSVFK